MKLLDIAEAAISEHGAMQKRTELAGLLALASYIQPTVIWEIGSATGGTLWALARALADMAPSKIVSIDLPGGPFSGGAQIEPDALEALISNATIGAYGVEVVALHGRSDEVALPRQRPDLLLIDGDHSEAGVRADWKRYGPLVNAGGLLCFHDILPHPEATGVEVAPVWADVQLIERHTLEIIDPADLSPGGHPWGGLGVVFR